ncbi:MAG TPA: hypothetical protein VFU46_01165 [Gemmatimonadales bacterium]|nr:hypothetical protein [Gemmatimonadales bacterium]
MKDARSAGDRRRTAAVVVGLFPDPETAERGVRALNSAGFGRDVIGIAMRQRTDEGELLRESGSRAAQGAVAGAVGGGILGGVVGLLVGVGALVIPGIGPVVAGGAIATALGIAGGTAVAGAGIGAASGGLVGALIGMGIPEHEARRFGRGFEQGGTLITVRAGGRAQEALMLLRANGADVGPTEIVEALEQYGPYEGPERRDPEHHGRRETDTQPA